MNICTFFLFCAILLSYNIHFSTFWSADRLTKIPKAAPCTEPAVTDNAECLRAVRENLDKSLWGKAFAVRDMKIPEGKNKGGGQYASETDDRYF